MKLYKFIKAIIKQIKTEKLAIGLKEQEKIKFEKEIIKLLKKFKLYTNSKSVLQRVEIIVDVDDLPKIKLNYVIVDK
jgi:adenine specific DNA methylase Mod